MFATIIVLICGVIIGYGALALAAKIFRQRLFAARNKRNQSEIELLIEAVHAAKESGRPVCFNHGGSQIENVRILEADSGVFYYGFEGGGRRRTNYSMVADFRSAQPAAL